MDYEVIISGGGLNGITLALALNDAGISVAIVDKRAQETISINNFNGRSYAPVSYTHLTLPTTPYV